VQGFKPEFQKCCFCVILSCLRCCPCCIPNRGAHVDDGPELWNYVFRGQGEPTENLEKLGVPVAHALYKQTGDRVPPHWKKDLSSSNGRTKGDGPIPFPRKSSSGEGKGLGKLKEEEDQSVFSDSEVVMPKRSSSAKDPSPRPSLVSFFTPSIRGVTESRRSSGSSVEIDDDSKVIVETDGYSHIPKLSKEGFTCVLEVDSWVQSVKEEVKHLLYKEYSSPWSVLMSIDYTLDFFQEGRHPDYLNRNLAAIIKSAGTYTINVTKASLSHDLEHWLYLDLYFLIEESHKLLSGFTILPHRAAFSSLSFKLGHMSGGFFQSPYPRITTPKKVIIRSNYTGLIPSLEHISKEVVHTGIETERPKVTASDFLESLKAEGRFSRR
jgi:hypothetical protein